MQVVVFLLIASVLVAGGFLYAFLRAVRQGQYDDLVTPSVRVLFDDLPLDPTTPDKARTSQEP